MEAFDFTFNPRIKRGTITDLGTCLFIEKREHVLVYGPAGVGKTHLAQALGHALKLEEQLKTEVTGCCNGQRLLIRQILPTE